MLLEQGRHTLGVVIPNVCLDHLRLITLGGQRLPVAVHSSLYLRSLLLRQLVEHAIRRGLLLERLHLRII